MNVRIPDLRKGLHWSVGQTAPWPESYPVVWRWWWWRWGRLMATYLVLSTVCWSTQGAHHMRTVPPVWHWQFVQQACPIMLYNWDCRTLPSLPSLSSQNNNNQHQPSYQPTNPSVSPVLFTVSALCNALQQLQGKSSNVFWVRVPCFNWIVIQIHGMPCVRHGGRYCQRMSFIY